MCARCREAVEFLVDRETYEGFSSYPITTEDEERRATARTAAAVYSALLDGATCKACEAMDGKTTTDLHEAGGWTPNPQCTTPKAAVAYSSTRWSV